MMEQTRLLKPLIIGEAPSKNEDPARIVPIGGRIGRRLADCCGLSLEDFLNHFDRMNLLDARQDTKEKGFEFDVAAAMRRATMLRSEWTSPRIVILLGSRVQQAFRFGQYPPFWPIALLNGVTVYVMPHPSGVNRWWNDLDNVLRASGFMRGIVSSTRASA
jgi:uracil-DNA glycosylase